MSDLHNLVRFSDLTLYPSGVNRILRPLLWLGYISYCLILLFRFYRSYPRQTRIPLTDALPVFRFLLFFLLLSLFTCASYLAISLLISSDASISRIRYLSSPLMSLVLAGLFGLIMILLINPAVLYGIPRLRREGQIRETVTSMEVKAQDFDREEPEVERVNEEHLREAGERFSELAASIPRLIAERKLYLNPDFSLDDLAKALDVPKHHLYYCFNSLLHTRFTRMRTEFRVRHVQQLIREGASKQKTLDAIGLESGFSSSATFRAAFRDVTGMSPSEYQASLASS